MAKRWWDIQHTTFMRMGDIEKELKMGQCLYVKLLQDKKDNVFNYPWIKNNELKYNYDFKRKGIQSNLCFFPIILTISWGIFSYIKIKDLVWVRYFIMGYISFFIIINSLNIFYFVKRKLEKVIKKWE